MKIFLFFICLVLSSGIYAQQQEKPLHYWGKVNEFVAEQAEETFQLVNQILEANPPVQDEPLIRKSALLHLDWILHDTRLDDSEPIYRFMTYRIQQVIKGLDKPVEKGMKIYKLYNHAFVVKTKSVTIAFDLYRGGSKAGKPYISNDVMQAIAERCDMMFVTHAHGDHADGAVADIFIEAGKRIIAPTGLWENKSDLIKHMRSEKIINEKVKLKSGKTLQVKIMPGHQDNVPNNVYIVTLPEGFSVAHTGDQWKKDDDEWINNVKNHTSIDVLLLHCWAMPLEKMANGFNPRLIIVGHENEMDHSVDHREPYWLNYKRTENVIQPKIFMTWGECYQYK